LDVWEAALEERESAVLHWFKEACASSVSIDGRIIREKALPITPHLGGATKWFIEL
jgi:hypothetical protein